MMSAKKNILLINLWPGAPMHYTSQFANSIASQHNVTLMLSKDCQTDLVNETVKIKSVNQGVPRRYNLFRDYLALIYPSAYFSIFRKVLESKPDVVIIVFFHPYLVSLFFFLKSILFIYHDPEGHEGEKNVVLHRLIRICSYQSRINFVHSEFLIPGNISIFQKTKYQVIPHGSFDFLTAKGDPDIKSENQILFFGRFIRYKGIEYLLRAFAMIQNIFPDWKLVIKGSGDEYFTEDLDKINPGQLVYENRYIPDDELADTVRRSKIIVLPYTDGSQSGVIALAAAFKKAVISTGVSGIKDQLGGKDAIQIAPGDVNKLKERMVQLISNPDDIELSALKLKQDYTNYLSNNNLFSTLNRVTQYSTKPIVTAPIH